MPRLAANLSTMYGELPFLDRFEAAARDGFRAVEFQFPYAWPAAEVAARLRAHGLAQVLFNAPVGGSTPETIDAAWASGMRGTASLPDREAEFRAGLRLALDYAERIDGPRIHVMAGVLAPGGDRARALSAYRANLAWAATEAARAGRELLIEPINPRDMPGYLLQTQEEAHAVVQDVASASAQGLKVQMDLYHCQIVEGDVAAKIRRYLPTGRVGHLQIAGVPLRQEPDRGELDPARLFETIDAVAGACGWQGWVGCEYRPRAGTSEGLAWARSWLAHA